MPGLAELTENQPPGLGNKLQVAESYKMGGRGSWGYGECEQGLLVSDGRMWWQRWFRTSLLCHVLDGEISCRLTDQKCSAGKVHPKVLVYWLLNLLEAG